LFTAGCAAPAAAPLRPPSVDISGKWTGTWSGYGINHISRQEPAMAQFAQDGPTGHGRLTLENTAASESDVMIMPSAAGVPQAGTSLGEPATDTRQILQFATVESFGYQQRVGISTPFARATSRIVAPASKANSRPLRVIRGILDNTGGGWKCTGPAAGRPFLHSRANCAAQVTATNYFFFAAFFLVAFFAFFLAAMTYPPVGGIPPTILMIAGSRRVTRYLDAIRCLPMFEIVSNRARAHRRFDSISSTCRDS